jgi:hypothetical protein
MLTIINELCEFRFFCFSGCPRSYTKTQTRPFPAFENNYNTSRNNILSLFSHFPPAGKYVNHVIKSVVTDFLQLCIRPLPCSQVSKHPSPMYQFSPFCRFFHRTTVINNNHYFNTHVPFKPYTQLLRLPNIDVHRLCVSFLCHTITSSTIVIDMDTNVRVKINYIIVYLFHVYFTIFL